MLRCALLFLVVITACKKDKAAGLPPAQEWGNPVAQGSAVPGTGPTNPEAANPHGADPHAGVPGMGGADPHAGVPGMGGADPHAGVPGMGTNPHGGGDPHGDAPPPPMAQKTDPKTLPRRPDGRLTLGPFALAVPKAWTEKPITSSMRAAHFALPAAKPNHDAELIVYYFGPDGAGSDEDNIARWLEQITQPDGKATKDVAKVEKLKVAGQDASYISVTGKYTPMAMGGGPNAPVDDAMMLAAIVKSPSGPYYFKLTGAKSTVQAQSQAFRTLVTSLKLDAVAK